MKKYTLIALAAVVPSLASAATYQCRITNVLSNNTFVCQKADGTQKRLFLSKVKGYDYNTQHGHRGRVLLHYAFHGDTIKVKEMNYKTKYGSTMAKAWFKHQGSWYSLNKEMVRNGYDMNRNF